MQSPHVRCWGDNGSRISVLRLVFRRRLARARGKLEHGRCRALPSLLALLADQPPDEIMHDEVELKLEGRSAGQLVVCKGTAEQAPGLIFEATLIRSRDQMPAKEDNREAPAFHPTKLPKLRGAR
jgi:hypothetical protein